MKNKIILIMLMCLCTPCFAQLTLVKEKDRNIHEMKLPAELIKEIKRESYNLSDVEIINYSVNKTSDLLEYSFEESLDLQAVSKAHCVTYSKLCSTICNIAFEHNNINSSAKCVVGYVYLGKTNLCALGASIFKKYSRYFINHDFVEINGYNYTILVDPTLYDVLKMDLKSITKHGQ